MSTRTPTIFTYARGAACIAVIGMLLTGATPADPKLAKYEAEERTVKAHIVTFDTLDFDVFTHQKWDRLHESHSRDRSEEHTSELQSQSNLVCRLLLEKKKKQHPVRYELNLT